MPGVAVSFHVRVDALEPLCVVGMGPVARALASRVLRYDDAALGGLRGVVAGDALLLLGPADSLPWVDGVFYLGCDPHSPLLLVPTNQSPDVPADAFERAILRRAGSARPPVAVLLDPPRLVSVAEARALDRGRLRAWLQTTTP